MRKCQRVAPAGGAGGWEARKSGGYDGTMAANQEDEAKLTALLLLLKYHYSTIRRPISHDNRGGEDEGSADNGVTSWSVAAARPDNIRRQSTTPTPKCTHSLIADTTRSLSFTAAKR
jgi:hypothetical protein